MNKFKSKWRAERLPLLNTCQSSYITSYVCTCVYIYIYSFIKHITACIIVYIFATNLQLNWFVIKLFLLISTREFLWHWFDFCIRHIFITWSPVIIMFNKITCVFISIYIQNIYIYIYLYRFLYTMEYFNEHGSDSK